MKISVILPTYRKNCQEELDNLHNYEGAKNCLGDEFKELYYKYVKNCKHILEPTLNCLLDQHFFIDDYEIILCHKYPEDIKEYLDSKHPNLRNMIKVVKEKDSIWHKLGDYATVNNNRNTGIIHAKGELFFFLDDMTIFNENLLQTVWDNYKDGFYTTCGVLKRIKVKDGEIHGTGKLNGLIGDIIPNSATWTYGMSVSMKDCLKINGFDEIYDGSFGGTDIDFGRRLSIVSRYKRRLGPMIYEFSHYSEQNKRKKIRDDEILRSMCRQSPNPRIYIANTWKPNETERERYKKWHKENVGELDPNWDKFMDISLYKIKEYR